MRIALAPVAVLLAACNPVFAPPVRSTHDGAPGHLSREHMEINIEANHYATGGPSLGYAVSDNVVVEAGVDSSDSWLMTFAGAKLQWRSAKEEEGFYVATELELGGGLGVGGACDDDEQCAGVVQLPAAYGGYTGVGLAAGYDWFAVYVRGRVQATDGDGLPVTTWITGLGGVQFSLGRYFLLHSGAGAASYSNEFDHASGLLLDVGLTFRWDTTAPPT